MTTTFPHLGSPCANKSAPCDIRATTREGLGVAGESKTGLINTRLQCGNMIGPEGEYVGVMAKGTCSVRLSMID